MSQISHMPNVDFELDTHTVILLSAGPRAEEMDQDQAQRFLDEHMAHTLRLVEQGQVLTAGALEDPQGRYTGLGLSGLSPAELRPLVEADPAVRAGLEQFELLTYRCPAGALAFPLARERPPA